MLSWANRQTNENLQRRIHHISSLILLSIDTKLNWSPSPPITYTHVEPVKHIPFSHTHTTRTPPHHLSCLFFVSLTIKALICQIDHNHLDSFRIRIIDQQANTHTHSFAHYMPQASLRSPARSTYSHSASHCLTLFHIGSHCLTVHIL